MEKRSLGNKIEIILLNIILCIPIFLLLTEKVFRFRYTRNVFLWVIAELIFSAALICIEKLTVKRTAGERLYNIPAFAKAKYILFCLGILCAAGVSVMIIRWGEMPRYKGDLTVEQATANFNDYNRYYKKYPNIELLSDGTFQKNSGYKKKAGTEDDYVFQDGSSWPEIHWITEGNIVTGVEVHIKSEAEPGAECPAYSDVLYLVTKALAEKDAGWIREKEYQALLKEFKTKNSGYEYHSFKHEWSSGEAECIRKVENGSYNTWHDAVIGSAETGKMSLDVTYSIHLK